MTTYINGTPHDVTIQAVEGDILVPPSGTVYRLAEVANPSGFDINGVQYANVMLGSAEPALPAQKSGVVHIVSMPLAMALLASGQWRPDVVYPYDMIRDDRGRITGCRKLACLVPPTAPTFRERIVAWWNRTCEWKN